MQNENPKSGEGICVTGVEKGSPAEKAGLRPGDMLVSINGEKILDVVDYLFLTQAEQLTLRLRSGGEARGVAVQKRETEPLGLEFAHSLMSPRRRCANKCIFCFEDQLPECARENLRAKDDDWRLSLMMGNFVTLTNVDERELERVISRRAGPLYISVHTTDPALRRRMMGNPRAGEILHQLKRLAEAGLSFHAQIVLCPGVNDGAALRRTLDDLSALRPYALSCALVPVGLTAHREGLCALKSYTPALARTLLGEVRALQREYRLKGSRFVFAADEFYVLADEALPSEEEYEDYSQLENGVGLMRRFQTEFEDGARHIRRWHSGRKTLVTGVLAGAWMRGLVAPLAAKGVQVDVVAAINRFFGEVTVAGLLTGSDVLAALRDRNVGESVLLPRSMLRHDGELLLDDMTPQALESALGVPLEWVDVDGYALAEALAR